MGSSTETRVADAQGKPLQTWTCTKRAQKSLPLWPVCSTGAAAPPVPSPRPAWSRRGPIFQGADHHPNGLQWERHSMAGLLINLSSQAWDGDHIKVLFP